MTDPIIGIGPATAEYMRKHGLWSTPRRSSGWWPGVNPKLEAQLHECARYPGRPRVVAKPDK